MKLRTTGIFTTALENENLHENSNGNSIRVANFVTSKYSVVKNPIFLYRNVHNYT